MTVILEPDLPDWCGERAGKINPMSAGNPTWHPCQDQVTGPWYLAG